MHRFSGRVSTWGEQRLFGPGNTCSAVRAVGRALRVSVSGLLLILMGACNGGSGGGGTPAPPSFTMTLSPPSLSIPAGGGGYATVTVTRISGFAEAIKLSLEGAPTGVVGSGTVAASAQTGQLALLVAPYVAPQNLDALRLKGTSNSLVQTATFRLVIGPRLPAGQIPTDRVQASGGLQRMGGMENTVVALEPVTAQSAKDASGNAELRHGFRPSGSPS